MPQPQLPATLLVAAKKEPLPYLSVKTPNELHFWIQLLHAPGIGPRRYRSLLDAIGTPEQIMNASQSQLIQAGLSNKLAMSIINTTADVTNADIKWLAEASNHAIVTLDDPQYPDLLRQIDSPPAVLFVQGNVDLLQDPQLAMVGSRNPTQGGKNTAYEFAKFLGANGITITSGLALGIDGYSHKGALDAPAPTIAVTATGLDRVYPASHRSLAHAILEYGAIVSEHTIGAPVRAQNFPRRNRIISGLSVGTLVIEAAIKSGSLITARYASEQGREVFAIPGSIHNPLARGCHQLIRQGAKLVETAEHILEEISPALQAYLATPRTHSSVSIDDDNKNHEIPTADCINLTTNNDNKLATEAVDKLDSDQRLVFQTLGYEPLPIDQLVVQTGLTVDKVSSILLILELHGHVESCGGGRYIRFKPDVTV